MNTKRKIMTNTPILKCIIVKNPISMWQIAEPAYPQINNVLRPQVLTVKMLINEAAKFTAQSKIVDIRGFNEPAPRTWLKICVEKSVIAWKPVSSLNITIAIEIQLPLLWDSSEKRAYRRVTSDVSPVFSFSRWTKISLALRSLPCVL